MRYFLSVILILLCLPLVVQARETVNFESLDGISITADLYEVDDSDAPMILLFHQAGWSRGAYREIAPKLNTMGYSCLAVDLRSGKEVNGIVNETHAQAVKKKYGTYYLDSYVDMAAAVNYVRDELDVKKVIIWGSSYSASLTFKLAADFKTMVTAVLAFSPGEYFKNKADSPLTGYVKNYALLLHQPVFITSAKSEKDMWMGVFAAVPHENKQSYLPTTDGNHGSRSLWEKFSDNEGYWKAVRKFLTSL